MAFRIETVNVTPAFARELLSRNVENNRNLRQTKVDQYARDIAANDWPKTGDTVKVSTEGRLIDGQHRMAAVVQADTTVQMLIAYDVDPAVMPVLDTGAARKFSDVLKISGSPQRSAVAAIVRRIVMWEAGNRMGSAGGAAPQPTHTELKLRYEKDVPGFDTASQRSTDIQRARLGAQAPAGTVFYLFAQLDIESAHRFFDAYISGANLNEGDPILALRNRMVRIGRDERLRTPEVQALFIRSWNAWREGRTLATVPITTGGRRLTNANYPVPQ